MIWGCKKIKRTGKKIHGDQGWLCFWCNMEFKKWNATKALNHLMRVARSHIIRCKGEIDAKHMHRCAGLLQKKESSKKKAAHVKAVMMDTLEDDNADLAAIADLSGKRRKMSTPAPKGST
jgi:hypothetical protein